MPSSDTRVEEVSRVRSTQRNAAEGEGREQPFRMVYNCFIVLPCYLREHI